ncbi:MAG: TatD family hydrolase [Desulfuromonadaceae bacterium]
MSANAEFLIDTHVHLDCTPLRETLSAEVAAAVCVGVHRFVVPGIWPAGWPLLLQTVREVPGALAAPGVHPLAAVAWSPEVARRLESCLDSAVAVGEIGLDGTLREPSPQRQEEVFRAQLQLAVALKKPVLIHCRKALGRVLELLRAEGAQQVGGILHAYSGSVESAQEAVRMNFALGVGGPITFAGARRILEVARRLPGEWLVLETDAPDLTPVPHRGGVNHCAYLPLIARRLAELRGWSDAETAEITTANAKRVLRLR